MEKAASLHAEKAAGNCPVRRSPPQKYNIDLYTGLTGLLTPDDISASAVLGRLGVEGQTQAPVLLGRLAFAVEEAGSVKLGRFEAPRPKMWLTLGPMKDRFDQYGQSSALIRVVKVEKEFEPQDLTLTYNKADAFVGKDKPAEQLFVLKDVVVRDVKRLKAVALAKVRAGEFAASIGDQAGKRPSDLQHQYIKADDRPSPTVANGSPRERARALTPISAAWPPCTGEPSMQRLYKDMVQTNQQLTLFSPVAGRQTDAKQPQDRRRVQARLPVAGHQEDRPDPADQDEYRKSKAMAAYQIDAIQSDGLALIHFDPDNLRKRMQFVRTKEDVYLPPPPSLNDIPEDF
jgi:hypothetical protein